MKQTQKQKQASSKNFLFERPTFTGYSDRITYIAKNDTVKASMPVSHTLYRCILASMRENKAKFSDVVTGKVPVKIKGTLLGLSDTQLTDLMSEFLENLKVIDK
jgi:hypothetical protein